MGDVIRKIVQFIHEVKQDVEWNPRKSMKSTEQKSHLTEQNNRKYCA